MQRLLMEIYERLHNHFGHQDWWPGETPFEVMVGAILTQNTNWTNVEKAIGNLKREGVLSPQQMYQLPIERLAELIKPSGYFRVKARRLVGFLQYLKDWQFDIGQLRSKPLHSLREELLQIKGVGQETADSILLYGLDKLTFVVDTYTYRVTFRHSLIDEEADYNALKELFEENIPADMELYKDFHAQLVAVGKNFCRRTQPLCETCPLVELRE